MDSLYTIIFMEKEYELRKDDIIRHGQRCRDYNCGCDTGLDKGFCCVCNQYMKDMGW